MFKKVHCSMFKKVHCLLFKNIYCLIFYFIMTSPQPSFLRQAQDKFGEGAKGKRRFFLCFIVLIVIYFLISL